MNLQIDSKLSSPVILVTSPLQAVITAEQRSFLIEKSVLQAFCIPQAVEIIGLSWYNNDDVWVKSCI